MFLLFVHRIFLSLSLLYIGHGRRIYLTETEKKWAGLLTISVMIALVLWGLIALIRFYFRGHMIRKKMRWSFSHDSFWDYDSIIEQAKSNYIKAQVFLNTNSVKNLKQISPNSKARLRLFAKKITSQNDIKFINAYIVCFDDKKNDLEDSVAVYLKFKVKPMFSYEEILVMHRNGQSWKITDYVKNPSIYMISHSRSIIEKS